MMKMEAVNYDVVIIGGGLSGMCAAISSARGGAKTALVQNRPVLGGNASSEVRMHICGADNHGHRDHARETGILEEFLLENRNQNPQNSYSVFDTVLWEKVRFQENLELYLNTQMTAVEMENNAEIKSVKANQLTTEKNFEFTAKIFIDATGDGTLAAYAKAPFMSGREAKAMFNEAHAPEKADHYTMGNTLLFNTKHMGEPIEFKKPFWANSYTEEDLQHRGHGAYGKNYWWIELGGDDTDIIADGEEIRDELLKAVYGVWDHIKNYGDHGANEYALDWVGFLPGKRESRRIEGDYILNENDLADTVEFEDAVAYGGWPMDMHAVGGIRAKLEPTVFIEVPDVYGIPYRSLYSKTVKNLMIGGRAISASHMAFGSTRVMGTCAVVGEAVGTAAGMAIAKGIMPRGVNAHMKELQQKLIKEDAYIPGVVNKDPLDVARTATIKVSSEQSGAEGENVVNGVARTVKEELNCWISQPIDKEEWISLNFKEAIAPKSIEIKFDSNLSKQIMLSMFGNGLAGQKKGIPEELAKDYSIQCYLKGELVDTLVVKDNYLRFKKHSLSSDIKCDEIKLAITKTNGTKEARVFEIRVYE